MTSFLDELERRLRASAEAEAAADASTGRFLDALEDRLRATAERAAATAAPGARGDARRRGRGAMRRRGAVRRRTIALAVAAVAGTAVPAVAALTSLWTPHVTSDGPRATMPASPVCGGQTALPRPRPTTTQAPIGRELASLLGALRRPRTPADALDVRQLDAGARGVHVGSIRMVGAAPGGQRFFVVPVDSIVRTRPAISDRCLARHSPRARRRLAGAPALPPTHGPLLCLQSGLGGNCGTTVGRLRDRGALAATPARAGDVRVTVVAGLVPDGVRAVTLRYGRSERTFSIKGNFYAFEVRLPIDRASHPDRIEWLLDDGTRRPVA